MASEIIGRYHLYRRKYRNPDGKVHTYWWYWWNEGDKRKQKPAGRACSKKVEAREFLEERIRQDALESKDALRAITPWSLNVLHRICRYALRSRSTTPPARR